MMPAAAAPHPDADSATTKFAATKSSHASCPTAMPDRSLQASRTLANVPGSVSQYFLEGTPRKYVEMTRTHWKMLLSGVVVAVDVGELVWVEEGVVVVVAVVVVVGVVDTTVEVGVVVVGVVVGVVTVHCLKAVLPLSAYSLTACVSACAAALHSVSPRASSPYTMNAPASKQLNASSLRGVSECLVYAAMIVWSAVCLECNKKMGEEEKIKTRFVKKK